MPYTKGPLTIKGPSTGTGPCDDGGDYAIVDGDNDIIGEAFNRTEWDKNVDARANAKLWSSAYRLLGACKIVLEELKSTGNVISDETIDIIQFSVDSAK